MVKSKYTTTHSNASSIFSKSTLAHLVTLAILAQLVQLAKLAQLDNFLNY